MEFSPEGRLYRCLGNHFANMVARATSFYGQFLARRNLFRICGAQFFGGLEKRPLCAHPEAKGETDQHQHNGSEECSTEAADVESRNQSAGQQQDDGVDDQKEQSQGQDTDWERQQFEKKSQCCIQEADDQRRDERAAETCDLKSWNDIRCNQQCDGAEEPDEQ